MAQLPPPPVPGGLPLPPPPPPRRRRLRKVVAAALVALLAISGVVVATSGAPPQRGIPLTSQGDGEFKFLNTLGDGTPFRWNPCEPIHYVANLSEAPPGALQDLQEAVARVSDVTGIAFVYDGETTDTVEHQYGRAFQAALPGQRWLPVLITWLGQKEFRFYVPDKAVLAFAYPRPGDGTLFDQYVSGVLVVDAGADLSQGFDSRYSDGLVLMHELGHIVGLDHVKDPNEVMFESRVLPGAAVDDWGPGDLEGLHLLGRDAGCLTDIRDDQASGSPSP